MQKMCKTIIEHKTQVTAEHSTSANALLSHFASPDPGEKASSKMVFVLAIQQYTNVDIVK